MWEREKNLWSTKSPVCLDHRSLYNSLIHEGGAGAHGWDFCDVLSLVRFSDVFFDCAISCILRRHVGGEGEIEVIYYVWC